jgi:hypothetical protein
VWLLTPSIHFLGVVCTYSVCAVGTCDATSAVLLQRHMCLWPGVLIHTSKQAVLAIAWFAVVAALCM